VKNPQHLTKMIGKKDWELILKNNEDELEKLLKNYELFLPQVNSIIALAKAKIAEYPEDKEDEMPEDIKEVIKEVKE